MSKQNLQTSLRQGGKAHAARTLAAGPYAGRGFRPPGIQPAQGRCMMHAVAALAAASAAAAAALVASATALASRASTSVRGARLACGGEHALEGS